MTKTMATTLTIGSTTNYLTRTNVLMSTVFIVVPSTMPIIVPFVIFMTSTTDIPVTITIRSLAITVTAIGVGSRRPGERTFCDSTHQERN